MYPIHVQLGSFHGKITVKIKYDDYNLLFLICRCSEKVGARRASERKEQYRQVRAHVAKEDGRVHAYGWSLPVKQSGPSPTPPVIPQSSSTSNSQVPVPVPVYCRPLMEKEPGMKVD